jgi:DNA-binding transcriptional ArsR family regulator
MVKKLTILYALMPFLTKPKEKLHLSAIARELDEPHPTVRLWLNRLEKKGVLKKSSQGRLTLYALNQGNRAILDYLTIAEKLKLVMMCEESPLMQEFVSFAQHTLPAGSKALIFGSAVESLHAAHDLDILIVGKGEMNALAEKARMLGKDAHIIHVKSFQQVSVALRNEITKKHLIINGTEEFVRWSVWQT